MFLIVSSVVSKRASIYLFAFLIIEVMTIFTIFEFIRKPWEGLEHKAEMDIQAHENNLFESISSYKTNDLGFGERHRQVKVTSIDNN